MRIKITDTQGLNEACSNWREQQIDDYLDDRQDIEDEIEEAELLELEARI